MKRLSCPAETPRKGIPDIAKKKRQDRNNTGSGLAERTSWWLTNLRAYAISMSGHILQFVAANVLMIRTLQLVQAQGNCQGHNGHMSPADCSAIVHLQRNCTPLVRVCFVIF